MPASAPVCDAAYQGAPGAYSEEAALALLGAGSSLLPSATLDDVFDALAAGAARHAVVPVENCLTGAVPSASELILAQDRPVIAETHVRIDHVLLAPPGTSLREIRRVLSHPVALAQCRRFFAAHGDIEPVPAFDTAGAVELVMGAPDGHSAALASRRSAALYGAAVIAQHIQDHAENWTRFLLVGPRTTSLPASIPRKALVVFALPHEPGALHQALAPLAHGAVNLTRIQSQPVHGRPFEYRFIVEIAAVDGDRLRAAIEHMQRVTRDLRVAGEYAPVTAIAT